MTKPILILDAFCGAGGAGMGYHQAAESMGIRCRIIGVDKDPQPYYPFEFVQGDAILFLYKYGHQFDFIHASPPCQMFSNSTAKFRAQGYQYPNLVPATRHMIERSGKPGVIENVTTAPIRKDLVLRGDQFGLKVIRRRGFEAVNCLLMKPGTPGKVRGSVLNGDFISVFGKGGYRKSTRMRKDWRPTFHKGSILADWRFAMGMPWGDYHALAEAIPPAYTKYIGESLFNQFKI